MFIQKNNEQIIILIGFSILKKLKRRFSMKRKNEVINVSSDEDVPQKVIKKVPSPIYTGESFFLNELSGQYPNLRKVNIKDVLDIVFLNV